MMSRNLFDIIENLVVHVVGYYFGNRECPARTSDSILVILRPTYIPGGGFRIFLMGGCPGHLVCLVCKNI